MVNKKMTVLEGMLCIETFCHFLHEKHCQPLDKDELHVHYMACREASGNIKWPSFGSLLYIMAWSKSEERIVSAGQRQYLCLVCNRSCADMRSMMIHLSTFEHLSYAQATCDADVAGGDATTRSCPLRGCHEQLESQAEMLRHVTKKPHHLLFVIPAGGGAWGETRVQPSYACLMCGGPFESKESLSFHLESCEHKETFANNKRLLAGGRSGIEVKFDGVPPLALTKNEMDTIHATVERSAGLGIILCTIWNKADDTFSMISCSFASKLRNFKLAWNAESQHIISGRCNVPLDAGQCYTLRLTASSFMSYGYYTGRLQLTFRKLSTGELVSIITPVNLRVVSPDYSLLQPTAPYRPRQPTFVLSGPILDGIKPDSVGNDSLTIVLPLKPYRIPNGMRLTATRRLFLNKVMRPLSEECYNEKMATLLHFEELQMEFDIKRYTMHCATMTREGTYLYLEVPGLAEKRPSVLKGDNVVVSVLTADHQPERAQGYRGYVHQVELNRLKLRFHPDLMRRFMNGMQFLVQFSFNRLPSQLSHRAAEIAVEHRLGSMLFPQPVDKLVVATRMLSMMSMAPLRFYDRLIESNEEQKKAVTAIAAGLSRPAPYLIFGPPGTGKTITMVEAIKQVHLLHSNSRILTCAPHNEAADLIADRLLKHLPKDDIIRLYAKSRMKSEIAYEKVAEVANYDLSGEVYYPSATALMYKRVIVSTLVTAGRLVSADLGQNFFTHIFIDECGHAIEPEALISISGLLDVTQGSGGQLVLAGDPKQLGPVIRSQVAVQNGLGLSLLERLMCDCKLYQKDPDSHAYDNDVLTKLVNNYRSHPDIITVPNELFYDSELRPCADKLDRNKFCNWSELPKKGFPILFYGVHGQDDREGDSPSFFNIDEAVTVGEYAQKLLELKSPKVKPEHIGIIAPYRKQIQKIRRLLQDKERKSPVQLGLPAIKVGSVEEFQGQERPVIIISTVRSVKPEYMKMDVTYGLGFLKNPKRFNVAITRAKSLLIIVGNPALLRRDKSWKRFIDFCRERGGVTPSHMFPSPDAESSANGDGDDSGNDFDLLEDIGEGDAGPDGVGHLQAIVDPEWRSQQ